NNGAGIGLGKMLDTMHPMFKHNMRITMRAVPGAKRDVRYFNEILPYACAFAISKERKPLAKEVDIETNLEKGQRSLWLKLNGIDPECIRFKHLGSSEFKVSVPKPGKPKKRLGVGLGNNNHWKSGLFVKNPKGQAQKNGVQGGDILLEVDDVKVTKVAEVGPMVRKHDWGDWVKLLLAREIAEEDLEIHEGRQERYLKRVHKRMKRAEKLKAEGKDPLDFVDDVLDEDEDEDEGEDGETVFEFGEDDGAGEEKKEDKRAEYANVLRKTMHLVTKYVRLRPNEGALVRRDFGASWNRMSKHKGVQLANVIPGGFADRMGFKNGDVIKNIGDANIDAVKDVRKWFAEFKFEKEPEDMRWVDIAVRRQWEKGKWKEVNIRCEWGRPISGRVHAKWHKPEDQLNVSVYNVSKFTVYFTDELIEPGRDFHLFINGVPYKDLVDPASTPKYPDPLRTDSRGKELLKKMRKERAKVTGWTPNPKWALQQWRKHRDRKLVFGAKRTWDVAPLKAGYAASKARENQRYLERGGRFDKAYEEHKAKADPG
ncbi:MAG: PDZ domain-containing protein, partial [Planctomycetota bacterium]|nr:PDZ domain-containing protein [Planctomycetota bacterium]